MKRTYFYITLLFAMLLMVSCEKDETKMIVLPAAEANAPEITLEGMSNYVTEDNIQPDGKLLDFYPSILAWTKTNLGSPEIPVSYTLQIDTTPDFTSKTQLALGINTYTYGILGSALNDWAIKYNLDVDNLKKTPLFMRVGASVYLNNNSIVNAPDTAFSEAAIINVTPILLGMPAIYVPGNHQGWNPGGAPKLYSPERNQIYTGFVYLDGEFKFTPKPNWDGPNFGAGPTEGTLIADNGAGNLQRPAGYYHITVDVPKLTYEIDLANWGIIGSAIGGWADGNQIPMTYDVAKGVLIATVTMVAGDYKFRMGFDWETALGASSTEGILTKTDGKDIPATPGKYVVTLNLAGNPNEYSYTITPAE